MKNVLIAVDGSDLDRTVLRCSHALFGDDAHYLVVNVHAEPLVYPTIALAHGMASTMATPELLRFVDDENSDPRAEAAAAAQRAAEIEGLTDVEVDVEAGDPVAAILAAAQENHVDVIAVGSHGRRWFERLFAPSVSNALVHKAHRPVLVIHTGDEAAEV